MKNVLIAGILGFLSVFAYGFFEYRKSYAIATTRLLAELSSMRGSLEALRKQNADLERRIAELTAGAIETDTSPPPGVTPPSPVNPGAVEGGEDVESWPPPPEEAKPYPGSHAWKSREALTDIKKHLALTAEQEKTLSERLLGYFSEKGGSIAGPQFLAARNQFVEEIAGRDRLDALKKLEIEEMQREFDRRVADETVLLGRNLQLSPEQEAKAKDALRAAELALAPERQKVSSKMREMMSLHFAGPEGQEDLQKGFDEVKQMNQTIKESRDRAVSQALESTLTDEQRNRLLEYQSIQEAQ